MADFFDGKDAGALRSISEVSAATGVKPHVLRYWEDQFEALKPLKRAGGRRLYRPQDVALIAQIQCLITQEGYTLKGAKAALGTRGRDRSGGGDAAAAPAVPKPVRGDSAEAFDLLPRLKRLRAMLADAIAA